jgi:hypothetical protein
MSETEETKQSTALTAVLQSIDWAYGHVVDGGLPGIPGAEELANDYIKKYPDREKAIDNLIDWQVFNAGTAGFLSGLGGIITLPVTLPANLLSVLYLQLRMVAAIAHIRGHNLKSDNVRALAIACLVGTGVTDLLKDAGVTVGTKMAQQAIMRIPGAVLININKAVGFRLVTKAGSQGAVNLVKIIPFIGGVVSGGFDAFVTRGIGAAAKLVFEPLPPNVATGDEAFVDGEKGEDAPT